MDSDTLAPGNDAGTCGVATARSDRPSGPPRGARSSFAAEKHAGSHPDGAGGAHSWASEDSAERGHASAAAALTAASGELGRRGGGVSPPSWHHPAAREGQPERLDAPVIVTRSGSVPTRGADRRRAARARKSEVFEGYPSGTTYVQPRLLASRVDALVVAYRVELSVAFTDELRERQSFADLGGGAELRLPSGIALALGRSRRQDFFSFENSDVRGAVDLRATGGWPLEVVVRATFLATHPLAEALAIADRVALGFGESRERRLRRFDLAADFIGWPLLRDDAERFSTRAGKSSFFVDSKDLDEAEAVLVRPAIREFSRNGVGVTGLAFASGNDLSARLYAKSFELSLPGREAKRAIEHELWRANGWRGEDVTRLEFQHRGTFLDEVKLRNPADLERQLDAIWAYDTQCFLRMKVPGTASRRERCAEDPRWLAARGVFRHDVSPIGRTRALRGGASAMQVIGATLSHSARAGKLRGLPRDEGRTPGDDPGDWLDEAVATYNLRDQLYEAVLSRTAPANERAAAEYTDRLVFRYGADALRVFSERVDGLNARFWSVDDEQCASPDQEQLGEASAKESSGA
jgi:hypothetical protein